MTNILHNKFFSIFYTIIRDIFFFIVILYLVFILLQRISGNNSIYGYRLFTVVTGSMAGVYDINDVIAVKDYDVLKLKVGDDIAYRGLRGGLEGKLITHRIIRINETDHGRVYVTRGVNAPTEDPSIESYQILGKVVGVVPIISTLNHIVKSQLGFFVLVFCPLVIVIVLEVLQTITDIKIEKEEIREIKHNESDGKERKLKNNNDIEIV